MPSHSSKKQPEKKGTQKKGQSRTFKRGTSGRRVSSTVSSTRGRSLASLSSRGVSSKSSSRPAPERARSRPSSSENPHTGSSLDELLREEGLFEQLTAAAIKETVSWQISQAMKERSITKSKMAEAMGTSRAQLDRLLDPRNESVTLSTLFRAAMVLGVHLRIELSDPVPQPAS